MDWKRAIDGSAVAGVLLAVIGGCGDPDARSWGAGSTPDGAQSRQSAAMQGAGDTAAGGAGEMGVQAPAMHDSIPGGATVDMPTGMGSFPGVDGQWGEPGPLGTVEEAAGPAHTVFRPAVLGGAGARHPVILWGNGTLMPTSSYGVLLAHWASHGFVVVAANSTSAGTGEEMLQGIDWLRNGPLADEVDLDQVGATGHSQGGSGAIVAGSDPRVHVSILIEPGPSYVGDDVGADSKGLQGPSFMIAGGNDNIVSPAGMVQPRYDKASHVDAVYGIHASADHFAPTGDAVTLRGYTTAFFRAHLMADPAARAEFYGASCGICSDPQWTVARNYE